MTDIRAHFEEWEQEQEDMRCETLEELLVLYRKWLYLEETEDIEITVAALLDRVIPGDPIWLQYIAPSGDKKTEILRSFSDYEKAYTIDTITNKTLVSGLTKRNKDTGELEPAAGLLPQMNGKVLVIKDFSTTLSKSEEYRTELYGQLRNIYDGHFEAGFGTLPQKISMPSNIGLIAAATPVIDRYTRMENSLGTRFLKVRSNTDPIKATKQALKNAENAEKMRYQLRGAVEYFTKSLKSRGVFEESNIPRLTQKQQDFIIQLALYVAQMRASVWAKFDSYGNIQTLESIDVEKPTRVAKQLMKTAQLLAIIRGHVKIEDTEIKTLQRLAKDTCEPTRQAIINAFWDRGKFDGSLSINDIDGITKEKGKRIHYRTASNELEIMETLGIVDSVGNKIFKMTEEFKKTALYSMMYPFVTSEKKLKYGLFPEVTTGEIVGHPTLQEEAQLLYSTIRKMQETEYRGPVPHEVVRERIGWGEVKYSRIFGILKREGRAYEPRPGFVKVT